MVTLGLFLCEYKTEAFRFYKIFVPVFGLAYFIGKNLALKDFRLVKLVIVSALACLFIVSIIGYLEILFDKNILYSYIYNPFYNMHLPGGRMMSTLMHPSVLGAYFTITLPLSFFIIEAADKKWVKLSGLTVFIIGVGALFFTFSRGAWIAVIASFFLCYSKKHARLFIWLILVLILLFLVLFILSDQGSFIRSTFSAEGIREGIIAESRIGLMPVMWKMFKSDPFFGIGLNHYRLMSDMYSSESIEEVFRIPDNMYLTIIVEMGILAFLAYISFIFVLMKKAIRFIARTRDELKRSSLLAFLTGLIAFMIKMATYDAFYWFCSILPFALFSGICIGLSRDN